MKESQEWNKKKKIDRPCGVSFHNRYAISTCNISAIDATVIRKHARHLMEDKLEDIGKIETFETHRIVASKNTLPNGL